MKTKVLLFVSLIALNLCSWGAQAMNTVSSPTPIYNRILNLFEHHENSHDVICFTPTRNYTFEYPNWTDPYGSPFGDMRLYVGIYTNYNLTQHEMCYCLDSYLGLGYDYITNNYYVNHEHPVNWTIKAMDSVFPNQHLRTYYHSLTVEYGQLNIVTPPDPYN